MGQMVKQDAQRYVVRRWSSFKQEMMRLGTETRTLDLPHVSSRQVVSENPSPRKTEGFQ